MTKNVTLRMDEGLLAEFRHKAVDANMSLSAWITVTLKRLVDRTGEDDAARTRAITRMERGFRLGGRPMSRDEIHAR